MQGEISFLKFITNKDANSESPEKGKDFSYNEEDISYDKALCNVLKSFLEDEKFISKDIEVFEVRGNHAFTSDGVYATIYSANLVNKPSELN